jgi:hypothetical protein
MEHIGIISSISDEHVDNMSLSEVEQIQSVCNQEHKLDLLKNA